MDDLDRLIRDANPGRSREDMPLTPRAEETLQRILTADSENSGRDRPTPVRHPMRLHTNAPRQRVRRAVPGTRQRREVSRPGPTGRSGRRRRASLLTFGSAASLVLVAFVVFAFALTSSTRAVASTPPLLDTTPVAGEPADLLEEAAQMRLKTTSPDDSASLKSAERTIRMHQWALAVTEGENGEITSSEVVPESRETTFTADGLVTTRVVAGEPYPGESPDDLPVPGTVLWEEQRSVEEFFAHKPGEPPTDPASMSEYLSFSVVEGAPTLEDYFREVRSTLNSYVLTAEQEAAILRFLAAQDDLRVDGSTTDRLGRTGIVFRAADRSMGEYEELLIVSPETGKILAAETIYVGSSRDYLASPSVVEYAAWER